jgi:hypothetical protein
MFASMNATARRCRPAKPIRMRFQVQKKDMLRIVILTALGITLTACGIPFVDIDIPIVPGI